MNVFTFDLETQNHRYNKRLASPFDPRNYIVQIGWQFNDGEPQEKYYDENHRDPVLPCLDGVDVINGFNIKFDLLWVWNEPELQKFLKRGGRIYCGQYVEYLLGGMTQDVQMTSMNETAEQYGGGGKLDAVKEMWQNGVLTADIPQELLTDYLIGDDDEVVGDIKNTWLIMQGQLKRIKEEMAPEFATMMWMRMDGLLATTMMEHNGVHIDREIGEAGQKQQSADLEKAIVELDTFIPELPPEFEFNWGSPVHKSCLIFGGVANYKKWAPHTDENGNVLYAQKAEDWPLFTMIEDGKKNTNPVSPDDALKAGDYYVIIVPEGTPDAIQHQGRHLLIQDVYKAGKKKGEGKFKKVKVDDKDKPKGAIRDFPFKFDGYTSPSGRWKGKNTDAYGQPLYSTGAEVIEELAVRGLPFTNALATRTSIAKDLGTYYWAMDKKGEKKGMLTLVQDDGIIHHKLNHTSTVTSRMSSSDPKQNWGL